jgi:hypothetical protein
MRLLFIVGSSHHVEVPRIYVFYAALGVVDGAGLANLFAHSGDAVVICESNTVADVA